jgi:diguanylate cyclase (GGDEF)-like protein/PAS domain S-box-containing protein
VKARIRRFVNRFYLLPWLFIHKWCKTSSQCKDVAQQTNLSEANGTTIMMNLDVDILKLAVMDCRDGITVSDARLPDMPLVFVNPGFERMTGYPAEECVGKNCRFLQGDDREQAARAAINEVFRTNEPCLVTLRNYRKDGTLFYNELSLSPVLGNDGCVTHYLGIQKDVTDRVALENQFIQETSRLAIANQELTRLVTMDDLTSIYNRRFFDTQLEIQMRIGRRLKHPMSIFLVDIDYFKEYNDQYGHQAGDAALAAVAKSLNKSFRRGGDFVARYGGEEFVILTSHMTPEQAAAYAEALCRRVRELNIEHAGRSDGKGHLTISVGHATRQADVASGEELIAEADKALYSAKHAGRDQVVAADAAA